MDQSFLIEKFKINQKRFMSAHSIMIAFEGVPAIYFNSMFGTSNDEAKFVITGNNRDVNRYKWNLKNISNKLNNKNSKESYFYRKISNLLSIKKKQKAFHPNASRENINLGPKIFCFKRESINKKQTIICITNLSSETQYFKLNKKFLKYKNLLEGKIFFTHDKRIKLDPCQTIWLSNR